MISIWLTPSGEDLAYYQRVINELSATLETPSFEPHITLQVDIKRTWSLENYNDFIAFAEHRLPFEVQLKKLSSTHQYFQCLFLNVQLLHDELLQLRMASNDIFKTEETVYFPHLSLLYGDFEAATINRLIAEFGDTLDKIVLFDTIKIVETSENVPDWKVLKTLKIGKTA